MILIEKLDFCSSLIQIYSNICLCSAPMQNTCFNLLMMISNSVFLPNKTSSTNHAMILMALLFLLLIKVPWSNCVGVAPSLISSSLNLNTSTYLSINALSKFPYLVALGFFWRAYINSLFD